MLDLQLGRYYWEASPQGTYFLLRFLLTVFLQLVFQPLMSAQIGFMVAAWQPSGLGYYRAAAYLTNQRSKYSEGLGVGVVAYSGLMH